MSRVRLSDRRMAVLERVVWQGRAFELGVGFDAAGRVRELFLDGHKSGTDMEALLDDAAVLASLALQHGAAAGDLAASMGWALADGTDGRGGSDWGGEGRRPISLIGLVLATAAALERAGGA